MKEEKDVKKKHDHHRYQLRGKAQARLQPWTSCTWNKNIIYTSIFNCEALLKPVSNRCDTVLQDTHQRRRQVQNITAKDAPCPLADGFAFPQ